MFLIGRLIDFMVPDIPEDVEIKIKREHYMAKEALAENEVRTPVPLSRYLLVNRSINQPINQSNLYIIHRVILASFFNQ